MKKILTFAYTLARKALVLIIACCVTYQIITAKITSRELCVEYPPVNFDQSMEFLKNDSDCETRLWKKEHEIVAFCRILYEKNSPHNMPIQKNPLIPKIVHLIWVGPLEPPPVISQCLASIQEHLPDWDYKLWTDSDIPGLHLTNQKYYNEETCYGAKADILRYELLEKFGGVYLDIDVVLIKPLDYLHHMYEFYTSMAPSNMNDVMANCIIACTPGHPLIRACVDNIKYHRHHDHLLHRTGPRYFEKVFYDVMQQKEYPNVVALPKSFLLPLEYEQKECSSTELKMQIRPESLSIHFWANSWAASLPGNWGAPE